MKRFFEVSDCQDFDAQNKIDFLMLKFSEWLKFSILIWRKEARPVIRGEKTYEKRTEKSWQLVEFSGYPVSDGRNMFNNFFEDPPKTEFIDRDLI